MINLIIKYNGKYIVKNDIFGIDFIKIINNGSILGSISLYIMFLLNNLVDKRDVNFDYETSLDLMENSFLPEYLIPINSYSFIYDLDMMMKDNNCSFDFNIPSNLSSYSISELRNISNTNCDMDGYSSNIVCDELNSFINSDKSNSVNDKKVYLMFSAGKDSMLSASRLSKDYNVTLFHFDNGYMKDSDKPFLTYYFSNSLLNNNNINFVYLNSLSVNDIFNRNFSHWKNRNGDNLTDKSIDSEIRCLCCRCAMYEVLLKQSIIDGVKYIAEGARISQKFMIEQIPMINRFKELASRYDINCLYPVLYEDDDDKVKKELIDNGFSSKSWESKCLLGRKAMEKSEEDCNTILKYYDEIILPMMINSLDEIYAYYKANMLIKES